MFNNIADYSLHAGMEITHLKPDIPATNDTPPAKAAAGLHDAFSFGDFLSQGREPEQVQDKDRVKKSGIQDGAEILKGLAADDDAAKVNQIRSILERQLKNLCDEIISADMLSLSDIAEILRLENVITADLYYSLSKALKSCGQSAQEEQNGSRPMDLLYSLFPYLYSQLNEIYLRKRSTVMPACPRCGYVRDMTERACPRCGYIF